MTTQQPTGRIVPVADGFDLAVTRILPGSIRDAWASITEPERTARWIGRWEGTGAPGETIKVQMGFEDGSPWEDIRIVECDAPHRLRLVSLAAHGPWDVSFDLAEDGDNCELCFVMRQITPAEVGDVGPGWEFYLDQLVASTTDAPLPTFDDYYPAQREYFEAQVR